MVPRALWVVGVFVQDDPFPDPPTLVVPDHSPERVPDKYDLDFLEEDEEVEDGKGERSVEEIERSIQEKEAKTRAVVLEMVRVVRQPPPRVGGWMDECVRG